MTLNLLLSTLALATPRLHTAHLETDPRGTRLVVTVDGAEAPTLAKVGVRFTGGESLFLEAGPEALDGGSSTPAAMEPPPDDGSDVVISILIALREAEGPEPVTWISGGRVIIPPSVAQNAAASVEGLTYLGSAFGSAPADGGTWAQRVDAYWNAGTRTVDTEVHLTGGDLGAVLYSDVELSTESRYLSFEADSVPVDFTEMSKTFSTWVALGATPLRGDLTFQAAVFDERGAMVSTARMGGAVVGDPKGPQLRPHNGRETYPRGDILIGGEPIGIE
jgi:hypothetical protein